MTKKIINIGAAANDRQGDSLRSAFTKVNENFTELYVALGLDTGSLNIGAFEFTGSTISTTDSSSVIIDQATTVSSNLTVGGDLLPQTNLGGNLGSPTQKWKSLYLSSSTVYFNNIPMSVSSDGTLRINGSTISGGGGSYNDLTNKPTIPTDVSDLTDTTNLLSGAGTDPIFDTVTAVDGFYGEHTPQVGYQFTTGFFAATGDINTTTTYWTLWMDSTYDALVAAGDKTGWTLRSNLVGTNTVTITSYNYSVVGGFKRIDITTNANLTYTFDATQMIWTSPDYTAAVNGPVTLNAGSNVWSFSNTGNLTFPNSTVQTTAYPGTETAAKLPYYADTSARDTAIPSPANGMMVIVGGDVYFYGNAQWLQLTVAA